MTMHQSFPAAAQPAGAAPGAKCRYDTSDTIVRLRNASCFAMTGVASTGRPRGVHGAPRGSEAALLSGQDCCSAIRVVASLPEAPHISPHFSQNKFSKFNRLT